MTNNDIECGLAKKLLTRSYWEWEYCETGAPAINPKRPYGNSDVPEDIREILDLPDLSDEEAMKIHYRTFEVLMDMVRTSGKEHCMKDYPSED